MSDGTDVEDVEELGPVDWIVVEFPGSRFDGRIAPALADLDDDEIGGLRSFEAGLAMLVSEDDVVAAAEALEPGSSAALVVWENTWAVPFGRAVRGSGGHLVASGRIPVESILAAIADDDDDDEDGGR